MDNPTEIVRLRYAGRELNCLSNVAAAVSWVAHRQEACEVPRWGYQRPAEDLCRWFVRDRYEMSEPMEGTAGRLMVDGGKDGVSPLGIRCTADTTLEVNSCQLQVDRPRSLKLRRLGAYECHFWSAFRLVQVGEVARHDI